MKINIVFADRVVELSEFQDRLCWLKKRVIDWKFWVKFVLIGITSKVAIEQIIMVLKNA